MPRYLRVFLVGCIALTFGLLLFHAREPLRLNIGDPNTDANVLTSIRYVEDNGFRETAFTAITDVGPLTEDSLRDHHYSVIAFVIYGGVGAYLGLDNLAVLRLIAIAFSALAMLLLFFYARRMWTDAVAVIATMLFSTSLLWLTHADSLNAAPILQASAFLCLWGLVRAIETRKRRHYAAAFFGACACFLSGFDYWLLLPVVGMYTVYAKQGPRWLAWLVAAGCVSGFAIHAFVVSYTIGWDAFVVDLRMQFLERTAVTVHRRLESSFGTLARRYTFVFTPLFWVTVGYAVWRAVRAPSLKAVLEDGIAWMLAVSLVGTYVSSRFAASQMIGSQAMLPFYAIASAILIGRLLDANVFRRVFGLVWLVVAPLWSFYFLLAHPRSVLDRDDVAKATAYLAASDGNDFVISNLLLDGPIQAAFGRHNWPALDTAKVGDAPFAILDMLELAGTDRMHAIVFTSVESRLLDESLWQLAMHRRVWSVTGWPSLQRRKTDEVISSYDQLVLANLEAAGAIKVLDLGAFDVYRIDRSKILETFASQVPVVRTIDLSSVSSYRHRLLGWSEPRLTEDDRRGVAYIDGYFPCPNPAPATAPGAPKGNACKTLKTREGIAMMDQARSATAQLMIRVERACDLRLTVELGWSSLVDLSMNDYSEGQCVPANKVTFMVPRRSVRAGVNTLTLARRFTPDHERVEITSITIDPICDAP